MKAKKIIKQEIDLDIAKITLLSEEEYEAAKNIIPVRDDRWWLRSPIEFFEPIATYLVSKVGKLDSSYVPDIYGVRPALKIRNLKSSGLIIEDKIELAWHAWTVISDELALCDDIVGHTFFREDMKAEDANNYEKSDIKKWLENWAAENGIDISVVLTTT
ncbi:MAG: hypothetical protein IKR04_02805 [Clostridia bacterium]|nr:hypothetical protein [Clostridia bacterium]